MNLTELPIWSRIVEAARNAGCSMKVGPRAIFNHAAKGGYLKQAGPARKTRDYTIFFSPLDLLDLYGTGREDLPERRNRNYRALELLRSNRFTQADRDQRRAAKDKRFAARLKRATAKAQAERDLVLAIARMWDRNVTRLRGPSARGTVEYGQVTSGHTTWKHGRPRRYNAANAGVTHDAKHIFLHAVRGKIIAISMPPAALRKSAVIDELFPLGCLACRTNYSGVLATYACFGPGQWVCVGFSIRGVAVSERVARGEYTVTDAVAEPNAEVRRIMLERLGPDAILASGLLEEIHHDDFGTLYRETKWDGTNRGLALLKVVNATPEQDGSYKDYYLRVPPFMRTAKEAVAWTFGQKVDEYAPSMQS